MQQTANQILSDLTFFLVFQVLGTFDSLVGTVKRLLTEFMNSFMSSLTAVNETHETHEAMINNLFKFCHPNAV